MEGGKGTGILWGCGVLVGVFVLGLIALLFSGANVSPGYVGVVSTAGGGIDTNQQPFQQGFHLVAPFVTHVESVSIQPQNHKFSEVGTASQELQNVYVDGGVNYTINVESAAKLVIQNGSMDNGVPTNIIARVFDPAFQDYIKEIVPQYKAEDVLAHRSDIRNAVKAKLSEKATSYGITVTDVFITNIHFDTDYTKAIEAKQVAQQNLEQAKIDAQAVVTKAKGQADANALLTASLTQNLIEWQQLQVQQQEIAKWNGVMPQVVGSANPFVSLTAPAPTK